MLLDDEMDMRAGGGGMGRGSEVWELVFDKSNGVILVFVSSLLNEGTIEISTPAVFLCSNDDDEVLERGRLLL